MALSRTMEIIGRGMKMGMVGRCMSHLRRSSSWAWADKGGRKQCDALPPYIPGWKEQYDAIVRKHGHQLCYGNVKGLDFHHWLVILRPLRGRPSTDEVINYYIDTLAKLVHRDEAIKKIYSVATKQGYAFGAKISPKQADIVTEFSNVVGILPDEYSHNPSGKGYPLDPFINSRALPYDASRYPNLPSTCLVTKE